MRSSSDGPLAARAFLVDDLLSRVPTRRRHADRRALDLGAELAAVERDVILGAVARVGKIDTTARLLGMDRSTLRRRLAGYRHDTREGGDRMTSKKKPPMKKGKGPKGPVEC